MRAAAPIFATVLSVALAGAALPAAAQPFGAPAERNFYFGLMGGITGGGDKLAEVRYSNGDRESVRAGGLAHIAAGVVWQPVLAPLSVQATIGWHVDGITADNGDITFSRVPIEVLGYFTGVPNWRFGAGARFVRNAELEADVDGFVDTVTYKDATGLVLEAGYRIAPRGWLNLRYTDEQYEPERFNGAAIVPTGKTSARSVGLNLVWLF
jgi:hypothetical protein